MSTPATRWPFVLIAALTCACGEAGDERGAADGLPGEPAAPAVQAALLAPPPSIGLPLLPQSPGPGSPPTALLAADVRVPETHAPLAYVDPNTCGECHEEQAFLHARSHHGQAMAVASDESVLGDFDDALFEHGGTTSRFSRRGGAFFVQTDEVVGEPVELQLRYTFGVHPLQQYLVDAPGGRLQPLQVAWDVEQRRWFHLQGDQAPPPGDAYHWAGRGQNANAMCIECHTTAYDKGYDPASDAYSTTWLELGVGCQACHGPGSGHLAWVAAGAIYDEALVGADAPVAGFVQEPNGPDQVALCARCHSRRRQVSEDPRGQAAYLDAYAPSLLREGLYYPDGQILDEVFVYGSFAQSRMHGKGVRCGDCHDPHGLSLRASGNALCIQCHNDVRADPRFPSLTPGDYDTPEHHHHEQGGEGSACVDCHMPARTYMLVDPRRDHGFRVPRPDLSLALGVPDPCLACHDAERSNWSLAQVADWAQSSAQRSQIGQPHFASLLAAARQGDADPELADALAALARDPEHSAIVRASAVGHLVDRGAVDPALMAELAADAEPLVRAAAGATLDVLPAEQATVIAGGLLRDPLRSVRASAARSVGALPRELFERADVEPLSAAVAEFLATERALSDLPDGAFRLGLFAARAGHEDEAEMAYRRALSYDPPFLPARFNLVHLMDGQGRPAKAAALLREGIAHTPNEGELHYSLGLLLAQEGQVQTALPSLRRASELLPHNPRPALNLGLALLQLERPVEAQLALREAVARDPDEPDAWGTLLDLALAERDMAAALAHARQLRRLLPGPAPELDDLIAELESSLESSPGG